jgi:tetratricopeptide (TPR) repeat protein
LRAHFFFHRRAAGDLERARSYYERAIDADPAFAGAWAGLAGAYWLQVLEGDLDDEGGLQKVRAAAERALALDPNQVEAHLRMTNFYWSTGDPEMKLHHQRQAEAIAPNHPLLLAFQASHAAEKGQWTEAIALQRHVVAADPLSAVSQGNLAVMLMFAGRLEEAKAEVARLRDLDGQSMIDIEAHLLILERRFADAERVVSTWPNGVERQQCLALIHSGLGRKAEADAALAELISTHGAAHPFSVAEVYGYRGERDLAQRWLAATDRLPPHRRPGLMRDSPFLRNVGLMAGER